MLREEELFRTSWCQVQSTQTTSVSADTTSPIADERQGPMHSKWVSTEIAASIDQGNRPYLDDKNPDVPAGV